jgi:hypothetical protein
MGAWDALTPPFDPEEILARVDRYVAAKRDADAATGASHIDPETGFYNVRGLRRRVAELVADARRSERPVACVVVGPVPSELPPPAGTLLPLYDFGRGSAPSGPSTCRTGRRIS